MLSDRLYVSLCQCVNVAQHYPPNSTLQWGLLIIDSYLPIAHIMKVKPKMVSGIFLFVIFPSGVLTSTWSGITCLTAILTPEIGFSYYYQAQVKVPVRHWVTSHNTRILRQLSFLNLPLHEIIFMLGIHFLFTTRKKEENHNSPTNCIAMAAWYYDVVPKSNHSEIHPHIHCKVRAWNYRL